MDRCPTCQARLREPPVCGRCQSDLTLPLAAEAEAAEHVRLALAHLAGGDMAAAREAVEESLRLKRGALAAALRGFLEAPRPVAAVPELVEIEAPPPPPPLPHDDEPHEHGEEHHDSWVAKLMRAVKGI
ncbi:hypothetical protein [Methylomagnum sp.]